MKLIIMFIITIALLIAMPYAIDSIVPIENRIGDISYYDFHGILEDYYYPPHFDEPGDWAYYDNDLGSDSFIAIKMDGRWFGSFTCCVVDLEQFLNESVTVYCSSCCYDDCIDDVVRDDDWWIFWK